MCRVTSTFAPDHSRTQFSDAATTFVIEVTWYCGVMQPKLVSEILNEDTNMMYSRSCQCFTDAQWYRERGHCDNDVFPAAAVSRGCVQGQRTGWEKGFYPQTQLSLLLTIKIINVH